MSKFPGARKRLRLAAVTLSIPFGIAALPASPAHAAISAPAAPTGLKVVTVGDGRIDLDWADSRDLQAADRYQVYLDDTTVSGEDTWKGRVTAESRYTFTGLVNGRTYELRVGAGSTGRYGPWTDPAVKGTPAKVVSAAKPVAPTSVKVVSVGDGRIELDWADNTDLQAADKYQVYLDDTTVSGEDTWAGRETTESRYAFTGLVNGRTYEMRVGAGSAGRYGLWSDPAVKGTPAKPVAVAPGAPTGLKLLSAGDGRLEFDWSDSADLQSGDKYQVYLDDTTVSGEDTWAGRETAESRHTFTGLVNGRTYEVRIGAGSAGRFGPWSDPAVKGVPQGPVTTAPVTSAPVAAPAPAPNTATIPSNARYVALNGNDANAGTASSPFRTLTKAASVAGPGDTIVVRGGTYARERVNIGRSGTAASPITIRSFPGESVVFDGQTDTVSGANRWFTDAGLVTITASHVVFDGFEVKNSPTHGVHATGDGVVIRNNKVHHAWMNGLEMHVSDALVENNEIHDTAMDNYQSRRSYWAGGVNIGTRAQNVLGSNITVRRNFVHEIWGEGLNFVRVKNFHAHDNIVRNAHSVNMILEGQNGIVERNFVLRTSDWNPSRIARAFVWGEETHWTYNGQVPVLDLTIRNNVFANVTDAAFLRMAPGTYYQRVKIIGNTFYNSGIAADPVLGGSTNGNVLKNNIIGGRVFFAEAGAWDASHNAFPNGGAMGANAITAGPQYVNPGANTAEGFKLQAGSPLRDRGVTLPDLTGDFFGTSRGTSTTIGAHDA